MSKEQWQPHVDAFQTSGMSKLAYAKSHGLVYSQFLYWLLSQLEPQIIELIRFVLKLEQLLAIQPFDLVNTLEQGRISG